VTRAWSLAALAICGCASAANVAVLRTDDAPRRDPTDADRVQVVAATGTAGCIPLGRVGVTVARPSPANAPRFGAVRNLRIAAARLGADEVRDLRYEDSADALVWTSVTALACARPSAKPLRGSPDSPAEAPAAPR
jgi:hypothetical protein